MPSRAFHKKTDMHLMEAPKKNLEKCDTVVVFEGAAIFALGRYFQKAFQCSKLCLSARRLRQDHINLMLGKMNREYLKMTGGTPEVGSVKINLIDF